MTEEKKRYPERMEVVLKNIMATFVAKLKTAAEEAISDVELDFLPFLEQDLEQNVPTLTRQVIQEFLEGREQYVVDLSAYDMRGVRRKIFEDNREEIIAALGADFDKKIQDLNESLRLARRR